MTKFTKKLSMNSSKNGGKGRCTAGWESVLEDHRLGADVKALDQGITRQSLVFLAF